MVIHCVGVYWQISCIPGVGPVNANNKESAYDSACQPICRYMKWDLQWIQTVCNDVPVECGQGVETQAFLASSNCCQSKVCWLNPGNPVEETQSRKYVIWKPEIYEHSSKRGHEESITRYGPYFVPRTHHRMIFICGRVSCRLKYPVSDHPLLTSMKSTIERDCYERSRPNTKARIYQKASGKTSKAISHEICRQGKEYLVKE